jgi:NAD(P)H-dependent FMN reductase
MKIEIIAGSPRKTSITLRVALHLQQYLTEHTSHEIGLINTREWNLPPLESVFSSVENTPEKWKALSERMFAADAFILLSPEYNGSYSPALKNLLDHYPKQHHKPFAIATASPGALGGIRAAQQMQLLVIALFGIGSPYMLIVPQVDKKFDAKGNLLIKPF